MKGISHYLSLLSEFASKPPTEDYYSRPCEHCKAQFTTKNYGVWSVWRNKWEKYSSLQRL